MFWVSCSTQGRDAGNGHLPINTLIMQVMMLTAAAATLTMSGAKFIVVAAGIVKAHDNCLQPTTRNRGKYCAFLAAASVSPLWLLALPAYFLTPSFSVNLRHRHALSLLRSAALD